MSDPSTPIPGHVRGEATGAAQPGNVILEMRDITKEFPGVKALSNVSMAVRRGEVHASRRPPSARPQPPVGDTGLRSSASFSYTLVTEPALVSMEIGRFGPARASAHPLRGPGGSRVATADGRLVDEWHQQFYEAIDGPGTLASLLDRHFALGRVGLWGRWATAGSATTST